MPVGFQHKPITPKTSLGERLKTARRKKHASLETAEQETKIRRHYLEAIEEDRFFQLPAAHLKGFVRRYGDYLGLATSTIEQELEFLDLSPAGKQPFAPQPLVSRQQWLITPRVIAVVCSILVLIGFIGYVIYQVRQFAAAPVLQITQPVGDSVSTQDTFTIEGKTDPGVTVTVDSLQSTVQSDGTFKYPLTLRPGLNQVTIRAENRIKKQATKVVSILYQPPEVVPSPSPK